MNSIAIQLQRRYKGAPPKKGLDQAKRTATAVNKVVISKQEIGEVSLPADPVFEAPTLRPAIPVWGRIALAPLVIVLPLLCVIAAVLRISLRNQPPRTKHAWAAFLSTLLIISGLTTTVASVAVMSFQPAPLAAGTGLAELDERTTFPVLPATEPLDGPAVSQKLKPLVFVISPVARPWFSRGESASGMFGAGVLIQADAAGYLIATARHVVPERTSRVVVSSLSGQWSVADVVGRHKDLDLALVWLRRNSGGSAFSQPVTTAADGESIFVIGHPEGLRFAQSNGIVSRHEDGVVQISAPVSPGNSGGPVYDADGNLIAIVSRTFDKASEPNAENLGFAVPADALLRMDRWDLNDRGRQCLQKFSAIK